MTRQTACSQITARRNQVTGKVGFFEVVRPLLGERGWEGDREKREGRGIQQLLQQLDAGTYKRDSAELGDCVDKH